MKNDLYPKVCFGCSRPHILGKDMEVEIMDGAAVVAKGCEQLIKKVEEIVEPNKVVEPVKENE